MSKIINLGKGDQKGHQASDRGQNSLNSIFSSLLKVGDDVDFMPQLIILGEKIAKDLENQEHGIAHEISLLTRLLTFKSRAFAHLVKFLSSKREQFVHVLIQVLASDLVDTLEKQQYLQFRNLIYFICELAEVYQLTPLSTILFLERLVSFGREFDASHGSFAETTKGNSIYTPATFFIIDIITSCLLQHFTLFVNKCYVQFERLMAALSEHFNPFIIENENIDQRGQQLVNLFESYSVFKTETPLDEGSLEQNERNKDREIKPLVQVIDDGTGPIPKQCVIRFDKGSCSYGICRFRLLTGKKKQFDEEKASKKEEKSQSKDQSEPTGLQFPAVNFIQSAAIQRKIIFPPPQTSFRLVMASLTQSPLPSEDEMLLHEIVETVAQSFTESPREAASQLRAIIHLVSSDSNVMTSLNNIEEANEDQDSIQASSSSSSEIPAQAEVFPPISSISFPRMAQKQVIAVIFDSILSTFLSPSCLLATSLSSESEDVQTSLGSQYISFQSSEKRMNPIIPRLTPLFCTALLLELSKTENKEIPSLFAQSLFIFSCNTRRSDTECASNILSWAAHFVSNLEFKFPYQMWEPVLNLNISNPRRRYVESFLTKCLELSYLEGMKKVVSEKLHCLIPSEQQCGSEQDLPNMLPQLKKMQLSEPTRVGEDEEDGIDGERIMFTYLPPEFSIPSSSLLDLQLTIRTARKVFVDLPLGLAQHFTLGWKSISHFSKITETQHSNIQALMDIRMQKRVFDRDNNIIDIGSIIAHYIPHVIALRTLYQLWVQPKRASIQNDENISSLPSPTNMMRQRYTYGIRQLMLMKLISIPSIIIWAFLPHWGFWDEGKRLAQLQEDNNAEAQSADSLVKQDKVDQEGNEDTIEQQGKRLRIESDVKKEVSEQNIPAIPLASLSAEYFSPFVWDIIRWALNSHARLLGIIRTDLRTARTKLGAAGIVEYKRMDKDGEEDDSEKGRSKDRKQGMPTIAITIKSTTKQLQQQDTEGSAQSAPITDPVAVQQQKLQQHAQRVANALNNELKQFTTNFALIYTQAAALLLYIDDMQEAKRIEMENEEEREADIESSIQKDNQSKFDPLKLRIAKRLLEERILAEVRALTRRYRPHLVQAQADVGRLIREQLNIWSHNQLPNKTEDKEAGEDEDDWGESRERIAQELGAVLSALDL
ncbi:MAG: hypothetical protein EZS28_007193 [Streblomastix strix]|uniref:MIF4G-like type 1 domain-containing protein n=1 Tax=Streblomastix strix TaxID=222440 RepID=A0A5J4WQS5_9EUKA|nr:MAG: hypothetical protein EZS28_007193 [Streblomastix strix]